VDEDPATSWLTFSTKVSLAFSASRSLLLRAGLDARPLPIYERPRLCNNRKGKTTCEPEILYSFPHKELRDS
jgi:hypothetical protein